MTAMRELIIYSILPALLSLFIIAAAIWPERLIRKSRRDFFIRFRFIWMGLGIILLLGNLLNLFFRLLER